MKGGATIHALPLLLAAVALPVSTLRHRLWLKAQPPLEGTIRGNWCYGDCTTRFEKAYLENNTNNTMLRAGLNALRKQGCVAPRRKIITAGIFSSGSTLLFNQVRLWMNLAFPGNTSVGYDPSTTQYNMSHYNVLVAKIHMLNDYVANDASAVVTSRRSVLETLVTRLDRHPKIQDILNESQKSVSWRIRGECLRLMGLQRQVYGMWNKSGGKVGYDVLLQDYERNPRREIVNVAAAVGICREARENSALLAFVNAMGDYLRSQPGRDPNITQMHKISPSGRKDTLRPRVVRALEADKNCSRWADAGADYGHNAFAHKPKFDDFDALGYR